MDPPSIITYVYEYPDEPGAVEVRELGPGVEDVLTYEETYRMISRDSRIVWVRDRAEVEQLPDNSEVWRGSWTVIQEPGPSEQI